MKASFPAPELDAVGLQLRAAFDLATLPPALCPSDAAPPYTQLLLIGHAGPRLWQTLSAGPRAADHPIDRFSCAQVLHWFDRHHPGQQRKILYPLFEDSSSGSIPPLQALGELAGWHHPSPLGIGIHPHWGTWFAYRVALLAESTLTPTPHAAQQASPCTNCPDRPCQQHCPAQALNGPSPDLQRCLTHRLQANSPCRANCPARLACPVGTQHRYPTEQIAHGYGRSLKDLEKYI
jgi:hypothetical protein